MPVSYAYPQHPRATRIRERTERVEFDLEHGSEIPGGERIDQSVAAMSIRTSEKPEREVPVLRWSSASRQVSRNLSHQIQSRALRHRDADEQPLRMEID